MILEEETYEKFGYYPSNLKPQTKKKIIIVCDNCGEVREARKDKYSPLCKSCVQKGKTNKGNKGGTSWNKGLTKETDDRIKEQANTRIYLGLSKGKNNPGYIDGKWRERQEYYLDVNWIEIKKEVRKRDNNTCQICGKTEEKYGRELSVHHIIPFRICRNHKKANLITVCAACHNKIEPRR